jgi:hypothetical protein
VQVALHAAITTVPSGSTSVPSGNAKSNAKRGVRLGPILWAVPAIAVLGAAVATPLVLRRHRERTAPTRTNQTTDEG